MRSDDLEFPPCNPTSTVPVEEAREHFMDRFQQACYPSTLTPQAEVQLDRVFDRTVRHAMTEGFMWQLGEPCTQFALDRVAEIAVTAKLDASANQITSSTLEIATLKVIRYWKPKCEIERRARSSAENEGVYESSRSRAIFCTQYDID